MAASAPADRRTSDRAWAVRFPLVLGVVLTVCGGCDRKGPSSGATTPSLAEAGWEFAPSESLLGLRAELAQVVQRHLRTETGTPAAPRLVGDREVPAEELAAALSLFRTHCSGCHGSTGEGTGPWAHLLPVLPRDFRRGIFKFQSTPYGARPVRDDLERTITRGIPSSLMPPFGHLETDKRRQLALAVELLARRGEFENRLTLEVEVEGEGLTESAVAEIAADIDTQWREAAGQVIQPLSPQPEFTPERVARGKEKFVEKGCAKCHGEDGRGQTEQNLQGGLRDVWGHPVKAADLTTGRLKGGSAPLEVYRRILGGINGTPMPSFRAIVWAEPESIWDLVAWVRHLGRLDQPASGESSDD